MSKTQKTALIICLLLLLPASALASAADIIVDQFGYRPEARKVAVVRFPFDGHASTSVPISGGTYYIKECQTRKTVLRATLTDIMGGQTDEASGDRVWWLDFSGLTVPGIYYITDERHEARSCNFRVSSDVYEDVLRQAVRMFFYQRAGCEKPARYAGEGWADKASHLHPGQDLNARQGNRRDDASTERDVHGGWYDAGDYNKYPPWTCDYIEQMLMAYREHPSAFSDDYGIPESGNALPDILDEAKWGLDYLLRLQNADGSVFSLVNLDHASPPSAATGHSYYGPPPGFLAGGPYRHFRTEQSPEALAKARRMGLPEGLPPARMYADYNTSWPLNSWQLSEPSGAYQVAYIRLLSKY